MLRETVLLQKRLNRRVGEKEYSKWQVVIPPEIIEQLGWKEGDDLIEQVDEQKLTLMPKPKSDNLNYVRPRRARKL